jgi:hypothetical protein
MKFDQVKVEIQVTVLLVVLRRYTHTKPVVQELLYKR